LFLKERNVLDIISPPGQSSHVSEIESMHCLSLNLSGFFTDNLPRLFSLLSVNWSIIAYYTLSGEFISAGLNMSSVTL
ncbi:hypothetical protein ACQP3J_31915, partial [Escherichia coli]